MDVYTAIVSSGRAGNVPAMNRHTDGLVGPVVWYVGAGEAADYRYCGAAHVVEGGPLCEARNRALDDAQDKGMHCLQLSDDLRRVSVAHGNTRDQVEPITLLDAVGSLAEALFEHDAHLAGAAPTANPYFSKLRVHRSAFIVGDMVLVRAGCPLRWDEQLPLKEDYDYTCQHLARYGVVARADYLLADFLHRRNKGGAVAYRTSALEQQAIARLQAKWPGVIVPNPRRQDEVLLRWRPGSAQPRLV